MGKKTDRDIAEQFISLVGGIANKVNQIYLNLFHVLIITQPVSWVDCYIGDTVELSVVAANVSAYQWYKKTRFDTSFTRMTGETNSTLSFTAEEVSTTSYYCQLTGKDGIMTATQISGVQIRQQQGG